MNDSKSNQMKSIDDELIDFSQLQISSNTEPSSNKTELFQNVIISFDNKLKFYFLKIIIFFSGNQTNTRNK